MVMQSQKDNNNILHMHGATQCAENKILNTFKAIRALGGMLTEKQTIENLSFSILTSCHHSSLLSA